MNFRCNLALDRCPCETYNFAIFIDKFGLRVVTKWRITALQKNVPSATHSAGNAKAAEEAFKKVKPQMARGVAKGVLKKSTVARKISRLSTRIKNLKKTAKG